MAQANSTEKSNLVKNIIAGSPRFEDRFISDRSVLSSAIKTLKESGYKIVLTQGVYDLFHVGHKRYLEDAKSHGDILVIGVDTDELTKMRKGPSRPFDTLLDRLEILTALRAVDIVTTRHDDEHIYDLIKTVQPDVLIMSETTADFKEKDRLNLLKYCGEIKVLEAKSSTSTTAKLRKMMIDGAEQLGREITNLINNFLQGVRSESGDSVVLYSLKNSKRGASSKKIKTKSTSGKKSSNK